MPRDPRAGHGRGGGHRAQPPGDRRSRQPLVVGGVGRRGARAHAGFFDIDWHAPEPRRRGTIVLPVLDDHYGRALERGAIRVVPDDAELFVVAVGDDLVLPLSAATVGEILLSVARRLDDDEIGVAARTLTGLGVSGGRTDGEGIADARVAIDLAIARLSVADPDGVARAAVLAQLASDPVALDTLLDAQAYRLARWQVAADELDYRRFLDVNSLVALRTEDPEVFAATHRVLGGLVRDGSVDGLRVDHIDGMADPAGYCARLRALAPRAWIGVEKILAAEERLPPWPVDGTTGYDLAALDDPVPRRPAWGGPADEGLPGGNGRRAHLGGSRRRGEDRGPPHPSGQRRRPAGRAAGADLRAPAPACATSPVSSCTTRVAVASYTTGYRSYMRWTIDGQAERTHDDLAYVSRSVHWRAPPTRSSIRACSSSCT